MIASVRRVIAAATVSSWRGRRGGSSGIFSSSPNQQILARYCESAVIRRSLTAATSSQKRALNPEQLQGKHETTPKETKPTTPPPTTTASTTTSGSSNLLPVGIAGLAVAGGVAYYLSRDSSSSSPPPKPSTAALIPAKKDVIVEPAKDESKTPVVVQATTESESSSNKSSAMPATEGNRVVSIQVPDKMKGSAASAPPPPSHPEGGHRVTTATLVVPAKAAAPSVAAAVVSPAKTSLERDTSLTDQALSTLQTTTQQEAHDSLVQSHQSLWSSSTASHHPSLSSASSSLHQELEILSESQLKTRIVQLASELQERTKWEAVRLKEFLAMKEKETADKYQEILQKQRLEFEDVLARRLREQEHELSNQLRMALQQKEDAIQTLLKTALETQAYEHEQDKVAYEQAKTVELKAQLEQEYGQKLEEYKAQVTQELQQKVATLSSLSNKLKHLESALAASKTSQQGSLKAHKLSAAALSLSQKLETNGTAGTELQALQAAAGSEGVIPAALATIPAEVKSTGVPTVPELQARFDDVYKQCRKAALVPEGRPGLEGQLAGRVFYAVKYPPSPDDAAPEDNPNHPEYVLVRAKKHVQLGELDLAVEQLEKLKGQAAYTAQDWKKDALNRIAVEKALKVIKLECALVNESLLE